MKVVVIDDDPTGSQAVHSCPLLLRWDVQALRRGLRHGSPLLFVLANTRSSRQMLQRNATGRSSPTLKWLLRRKASTARRFSS
jgi:uncharacterized protein YgbK (DUF1537 family)